MLFKDYFHSHLMGSRSAFTFLFLSRLAARSFCLAAAMLKWGQVLLVAALLEHALRAHRTEANSSCFKQILGPASCHMSIHRRSTWIAQDCRCPQLRLESVRVRQKQNAKCAQHELRFNLVYIICLVVLQNCIIINGLATPHT